MDQIYIKTPNPKCRLFLKDDPILPPPPYRRERGELTREKVRGAIVHKADQNYQHDCLYLQSINSILNTSKDDI
jgi:hypothetical protein